MSYTKTVRLDKELFDLWNSNTPKLIKEFLKSRIPKTESIQKSILNSDNPESLKSKLINEKCKKIGELANLGVSDSYLDKLEAELKILENMEVNTD